MQTGRSASVGEKSRLGFSVDDDHETVADLVVGIKAVEDFHIEAIAQLEERFECPDGPVTLPVGRHAAFMATEEFGCRGQFPPSVKSSIGMRYDEDDILPRYSNPFLQGPDRIREMLDHV